MATKKARAGASGSPEQAAAVAAGVLWSCFARGLNAPDEQLAALAEAFRAEGLDPQLPFLERGSTDCYTLTGELPAAMPRRPIATAAHRFVSRSKLALHFAVARSLDSRAVLSAGVVVAISRLIYSLRVSSRLAQIFRLLA